MTLRETCGPDYIEVTGDAEFVAWAANAFRELVTLESARRYNEELKEELRLDHERERRRQQAVAELAHRFRLAIRDVLESPLLTERAK